VFGRTGVVEAEMNEYRTVVECSQVSELAAAEMTRKELDYDKKTSRVS
jgi:hypothetical protein